MVAMVVGVGSLWVYGGGSGFWDWLTFFWVSVHLQVRGGGEGGLLW